MIALGHQTHEAGKMDGLGRLAFNLCDDLAMRPRLRMFALAVLGCLVDRCFLLQPGKLDM
jgi:hypothetical protein